jgi:hypothetical protein
MNNIITCALAGAHQHRAPAASPLSHLHMAGGPGTFIVVTVLGILALPSTHALIRELVLVTRAIVLYRMLARRRDLSSTEYTTLAKLILKK